LILAGAIGGGLWFTLSKKTEVSETLLQEYLPEDAQNAEQVTEEIQEDSGSEENAESQNQEETQPETKGVSDYKYAESQADVSFAETFWDTFKDGSLGVEISYPKNSVNVVKTESSITFLRKTGYIFKIQIIETALTEKEYWKFIKASSLNYKVTETTFREKSALFLELEDISEYPGDKYLVKDGDLIYEIWYATYSDNLTDDDAKRIDIMLNSLKFI
jgi:hypothetical protein